MESSASINNKKTQNTNSNNNVSKLDARGSIQNNKFNDFANALVQLLKGFVDGN